MKKLAVIAAVVAMCGTSAMATLTAYGTWNLGPAANPDWDPADPAADAAYPAWEPEPGLDWLAMSDAPGDAVTGYPWTSPRRYPNSDGVGMWGGALKDDPGDGDLYITCENNGPIKTFNDFEGTAEFWFKPMWDPQQEVEQRILIAVNRNGPENDGLAIYYDGAGVMRTQMQARADLPVGGGIDHGHTWTTNPLVQDWNHIAVTWDANGVYSHANGVMTGQTLYAGPEKMDFYNDWMGMFLGMHPDSLYPPANGEWDSLAIWSDARYTGPDYNVPQEEIPEPATLALLGLGSLALIRRNRRS